MATKAENVLAASAKNRPPMLEKGSYDSWNSRTLLYIKGKENGEMLLDSISNDLTPKEKLRKSCDIKATTIILLSLPSDIYTLVNHHKIAKDIWNMVKELMEGTEFTKQEKESKLYDEFDRFTSKKGESIHLYYLRYAKLINDMNIIEMKMTHIQINTKFVNHLHPEWSMVVTAARQAKNLHEINFDQLYVYEPPVVQQQSHAPLTQLDSGFIVPSFLPTDDPIASLNKAMMLLSTAFNSRFPPTNNQLRTLSNPRTQATIQDGRVTVQNLHTTLIFKVDHVDAFDSDCSEAPTTIAIFMARLSPAGSVNGDVVGPTYDSDILSKSLETALQAIHDAITTHKVTASQHFETAFARTDSHTDLEDSTYDGVMTKS
ncbi:hypothetical protein Tco_1264818 [Tanacetum coccineum]